MASEKTFVRKIAPSKPTRNARIAAVRSSLTAYFLGSAETLEHFWNKANPSLGNKSPAELVKARRLGTVEQCVNDLRKSARSVGPKSKTEPTECTFAVVEGQTQNVLKQMKEIPVVHQVIAIEFPDPESYNTYVPVFRQMFNMMPAMMRKLKRRQDLLYARYFYSLAANLPIAIPKLRARRSSEIWDQFVKRDNQ